MLADGESLVSDGWGFTKSTVAAIRAERTDLVIRTGSAIVTGTVAAECAGVGARHRPNAAVRTIRSQVAVGVERAQTAVVTGAIEAVGAFV